MLKSYEALLDHGQIRWLESPPDLELARLIVTVLPSSPTDQPRQPEHSTVEVDQLLARTAGAWGSGAMKDVKALMARQRQSDWGDD